METDFETPPHHVCEICNDDGLCRNNIFSPKYDIDFSEYLDCMNYIKSKKSKPTENWLQGWIKSNKKLKIKVLKFLNTLTKIRK